MASAADPARDTIAAIVLDASGSPHGGAGLAALGEASTAHAPAAAPIPPLRVDHVVDLAPEPPPATEPPEPEPPPEPPPAAKPPAATAPPLVTRSAPPVEAPPAPPAEPPPPAQAGQVVAADDSANQPLDFTGFDVSTGSGQRYAGGVTTASGTSKRAIHTTDIDPGSVPDRAQGPSLARTVGLPTHDWRCPWPREADALSINERIVVLRVVVRADGTVSSATLVSDPGFGFGPVALDCARSQRFPPATDDAGRPITATSPPVRITFTRD